MPKTFLDELIEEKWPRLPKDCPLVWDESDSVAFELPWGIMGIHRNEETFWRNRNLDTPVDDLIPDNLKPDWMK